MFLVGDIGWHRYARSKIEEFDFSENLFLRKVLEEKFQQERWDRGIGLWGGVGVGKTFLLVQLYKNRYWWAVKTKGKVGFPVWIDFWELVYDVKKYGIGVLDEIVGSGEVIFIDDFMVRVMDWDMERMVAGYLVYRIYDNRKILCFSTNMRVADWDVDVRVKDRVIEMCSIYEVVGSSRRGERGLADV